MNGKYLLDTNIVIALFARDAFVIANISKAKTVFVAAAVIGELFYGAKKSGRVKENTRRIERFVRDNAILSCNAETALLYGEIKNNLRKKGRPIPENDIWIAATARQYALTLVSRDEHFQEVDRLHLEKW